MMHFVARVLRFIGLRRLADRIDPPAETNRGGGPAEE